MTTLIVIQSSKIQLLGKLLFKFNYLINYEQNELTVFGKSIVGDHAIGITRHQENPLKIRSDGDDVNKSAELAKLLPMSLINSETFQLLEGSPSNRRQFLDWGAFHFDIHFIQHWQQAQKCIKNRNILLRSGKLDRSLLQVWDQAFISAAEKVDQTRQRYLEGFVKVFIDVLNRLCDLPDLTLVYRRGWDKTKNLAEVLQDQLPRDLKTGYSHAGPQRADISIKLNGHPAHEVLSRGQQKLVVSAMKIAQGFYLSELKKSDFVFLVDDLPSELDATHQHQLCQLLEELGAQVFITAINPLTATSLWQHPERIKHFLVEDGQIKEQSGLETETVLAKI